MHIVFVLIILPLVGAAFISVLPLRYKPHFCVWILGLTFCAGLFLFLPVLQYKEIFAQKYFTEWFGLSFLADGLAAFMAAVSALVAFLISFYSLEYMREYRERGEFYFWVLLFVSSMMGLIFSANLILMFCFWEVTSVCSWRLIGFYRKDKDVKAADRAFLVTFFGASAMLAGMVLIYLQYGTLEVSLLKDKALVDLIASLLFIGIISKSAQLPLQTWLPDAGVAPTPVTALLHAAVLVKIGVYVFARVFTSTFLVSINFLNAAIALSIITIIVGGGCALVEKNIKRILAYSTISQLGYVILALSLTSEISLKIGLLYILAHAIAKAGLFLCAGIIEHQTGTKDINALGGLLHSMPLTAAAYLLCAFSVIGIAPFLGFWPKMMVVLLSIREGHILVGSLAVLGALFTLFYLMRLFDKVFLGEQKIKAQEPKNSAMVYVVMTCGILSLVLGLGVKPIFNLLTAAIR